MKLRYKFGIGFLGILVIAIIAVVITLSYESECPPLVVHSGDGPMMKSVRYHCYGSPEVLRLEEVERPEVSGNEVLVRVRAAGVNPYDWHFMRGEPYFMRVISGIGSPKDERLGVDYSGTVESVGPLVTKFKPGDEVFGGAGGAFAEFLKVSDDGAIASKPANVSHEEAAGVGIAGITALQGVRDKGRVNAGDTVLINGASGGVGTFAVQIAKAMGAEVTGVCSTRNVGMVHSIGADFVVDYKKEDFTEGAKRYDVILDMVGNHGLLDLRRVLEPDGTLVMIGSSNMGNFIGPLMRPLNAMVLSFFISQKLEGMLARLTQEDLKLLADLMRTGELKPVIDRRYDLSEIADAMAYSEAGHARGKIIINVSK